MLQKCVRSSVLFFALLLSSGCSRDGVLENPDGGITVTTREAIHGRVGHLVEFTIGNSADRVTDQVVLRLQDSDVTDSVLFLSLEHTLDTTTSVATLFRVLKQATSVSLVPALPRGVKQRGGVILSFGEKTDPSFLIYLRVVTTTETLYWSVRGTLGADRRDWFLTEVRKPPKAVGVEPLQVVEISYYADENLTQPLTDTVMVNSAVYTKVVYSRDVPIVFADNHRARPRINFLRQSGKPQYRMKPPGTPLQSGDASPYQGSRRVFICKYIIMSIDKGGSFRTTTYPPADSETLEVAFSQFIGEIPPNTGTTIVDWQLSDFVGQVYAIPFYVEPLRRLSIPIAGVTVTIVTGPRAGESMVTDVNGRYLFPNVAGTSLHLRTERPFFEPKEVIVYRSQPTALSNGLVPNYWMDPQREPGNILIGQQWPDGVRFIFEETLLPYDLLYVETGVEGNFVGLHTPGVAAVREGLQSLSAAAHEIAHAHQYAVVYVDGGGEEARRSPLSSPARWEKSPEGIAFAAARAKDWAEVGDDELGIDTRSHYRDKLAENAAEVSAYYWGVDSPRTKNLDQLAPNRYQWAAEWLPKK